MPRLNWTSLVAGLLMVAAAAASVLARPTDKLADAKPAVALANLLPGSFGDWYEETDAPGQIINPETRKRLDEIYSQTLSRNYVNSSGYRIMVALAYGGDQRRQLQVHKPEVCYAGVGFSIESTEPSAIKTVYGVVPAQRVFAVRETRREPITYWWKVGEKVVNGDVERKLAEMRYTLTGTIPDGLLVRLSSIDADKVNAFQIQEEFANQLMQALDASGRKQLAGL